MSSTSEEADLGDTEAPDAANGPIDVPQAKAVAKQPKSSVPAQDNRPPAEPDAEPAAEAPLPMADNADACVNVEADALPSGTEVEPERKKKKKRRRKKRQRESEDHAIASQPQSSDDSQASLAPTKKKHKTCKVGLYSGVPGSKHKLIDAPTSMLYTLICKLIC